MAPSMPYVPIAAKTPAPMIRALFHELFEPPPLACQRRARSTRFKPFILSSMLAMASWKSPGSARVATIQPKISVLTSSRLSRMW